MNLLLAFTYGFLTAIAWTWWATAVAFQSPFHAAIADFGIVILGGVSMNFIARRRYEEFFAYAVAAALGTYAIVWLAQ